MPVHHRPAHDTLTNLPEYRAIESKIRALGRRGYCGPCARQIATLGWTGLPHLCPGCQRLADKESLARQQGVPR
jgi:hypothetical protein